MALAALFALASATAAAGTPAPPPAFTIPFEYRDDFIVVTAYLNGFFRAELLFDTGSEHTIVTEPALFPALNLADVEPIRIVGSDLSTTIDAALSRRNTLAVGGLSLSNQPLIAVDDAALDLTELAGEDVAGILGVGAFGAYVIEIDYRRRLIQLTPPERFRPARAAARVRVDRDAGKSYVTLETRVHAAYRDSLRFLLDTGAALEALVFAAPADSALYPPRVVAGVIGHGLGGALAGFVGRSDTLYMPGRAFAGVVTHFQVLPEGAPRDSTRAPRSPADGREGIIGNALLRHFHVAIDYPGGYAYFTPRGRPPRPRPYDRSGLTLVDEPQRRGAARVQFVAPGTPAAAAGLRAGDRVRKIDGIPVRLLATERLRRRLRRAPGKVTRLLIEREGREFVAEIVLRDLI